ncbi:MAG: DUF429 domain-containing protein [Candidatus Limnocylindria bacterium]
MAGSPLVSGVDGCRAGWIVATRSLADTASVPEVSITLIPTFAELLRFERHLLTIDIPIGLLSEHRIGGRRCDAELRALLGWPRRADEPPDLRHPPEGR